MKFKGRCKVQSKRKQNKLKRNETIEIKTKRNEWNWNETKQIKTEQIEIERIKCNISFIVNLNILIAHRHTSYHNYIDEVQGSL